MGARTAATQLAEMMATRAARTNPPVFVGFRGEIAAYNPNDGTVKVSYYHASDQPTTTQWIPLMTLMAANGYGEAWGTEVGAQVAVLSFDPAGDHLIALGFTFNSGADFPMNVPPSEKWTVDKRGSSIKFQADGASPGDGQAGLNLEGAGYGSWVTPLLELAKKNLDPVTASAYNQQFAQALANAIMTAVAQMFTAFAVTVQPGSGVPPPTTVSVTAPTGSQTVRVAN
jgi:type VI secretion system (T6SS) baseplate-like injector VgrG